jgi:glutamate receptor, ionotropic, invertebrate
MSITVLVTTYCGNLVAFLTFPTVEVSVKTVADLVANRGTLSWGMRSRFDFFPRKTFFLQIFPTGGTYLEDFIKDSDPERVPQKYQELYKRATFYDDENEDIIDDVRKGKHVYIDWRSNLRSIMRREFLNTETCDFALSTEEFMEEQIALTLPINSPYIDVFNAGRRIFF